MDEESTGGMVILLEITCSGRSNPPEKWDFAGKYQLIDEEFTRGRGFRRELPAHLS
jgi:hypothetical protein